MFGIKKKGAEIKQPVYVVLVPEVAAYASAASFPVDSAGKLVFLNDTVEHEGSEYQVVAMSHRNKVVIRPKGQTYGGKWVKAGSVRVTRHVLGGALMIGRKLRAKKVNEGIEMPRYAHEGDAGLDLRITETVTLEPMQKCVVGCGLAVEIPSGCVGLVFPRSGLAAKQGITLSNSVGVIDSGYRGEVCAALINQSYETVTLEAGTRVCQLVVMPYVPCDLVPVDELSDTERGAGGFGSTGVE
jgi:dUTP pyrophosphatase